MHQEIVPLKNQTEKIKIRNQRIMNIKNGIKAKLQIKKQHFQGNDGQTETMPSEKSFGSKLTEKKIEPTDIFYKKYKMLEKIGEGASGVVHKCLHKKTNEIFAVKKISYELQNLKNIKQYFSYMHEIDHPSIIKTKSLYVANSEKTALLVQQIFQHTQLSSYEMKDQNQIREVSEKLLLAVEHIHENGICHRDIKPDNILYDPIQKQIRLIDFGVSKRTRIRKVYHQLLTCTGTLKYKAPQMFKGGVYNELVDQWAVGVTIYQLITGTTPFESDYVSSIIQNIEKGQIKFDTQIWNKYSTDIKDLICKLLSPKQKRLSAKQALKHIWFTSHINSARISNLRKRGYVAKQTMRQNFVAKIKVNGKYSIREQDENDGGISPSKLPKNRLQDYFSENNFANFTSVQYDSDEQVFTPTDLKDYYL